MFRAQLISGMLKVEYAIYIQKLPIKFGIETKAIQSI